MQGLLEEVVQLVPALYSPTTAPSQQVAIQSRLQIIQNSDEAWSMVEQLLWNGDAHIRFFGASTLQTKIALSWETLPSTAHEPLRTSLLHWLATSASRAYPKSQSTQASTSMMGERIVLRKLAAAVTSLSLRLEDWNDWLLEVLMRVSAGDGSPEGRVSEEAALEVLSDVIEQVSRADLVGHKRSKYMASLSSSIPHLVTTLASILSNTNSPPSLPNSALNCFTAYLIAGQIGQLELIELYPLLLPHLSRVDTTIAACTAVGEIVELSSGLSGSKAGVTRFINRQRISELTYWATSEYVQQTIVEAVSEGKEGGSPSDEAISVMKMICTLSEHLVSFLITPAPSPFTSKENLTLQSPPVLKLLQTLLTITTYPGHETESYNVNELTSGFWMALQEESADVGLVAGCNDGKEGRSGREGDWIVILDVFTALAEGLRKRAERPPMEIIRQWPKDKLDNFRIYRSTVIADVVLYTYYTLRENMLEGLVNLASHQLPGHPQFQPPTSEDAFEDLEATLFCILSVQEAIYDPKETSHLEPLFSSSILGQIPKMHHLSVRNTALRVTGAYSSWFSSYPEACLSAITYVVEGLQEPKLCAPAARALMLLCDANRKNLIPHVGIFINVLGGLEGRIDELELVKVLESVSSVIQALSADQIIEPLLAITIPVIDHLEESLRLFGQDPLQARELCLRQLANLSACAKGLSNPDEELVLLNSGIDDDDEDDAEKRVREDANRVNQDARIVTMKHRLGNAIESIAKVWPGDSEITQALSDFIRHSTRDAVPKPLALDTQALLALAASALHTSISPVWLSIAESLVARLGKIQNEREINEEQMAMIGNPIERILSVVLNAFTSLSEMNENPDVVQAFSSFSLAIIRFYPRIFITIPEHLAAIVRFAELALGMQERFSLKANIDLLIASVQQTKMASKSALVFIEVILQRSRSILSNLLISIGGGVPRSHLTSLTELLQACVLRLPDVTRSDLKELLAQSDFPTNKANIDAKLKFERAILAARTSRQARLAVSDFALVCRGLDGSAYGAASLTAFD